MPSPNVRTGVLATQGTMGHQGKETDLVKAADRPSSVNLIYSMNEEMGALAESLKIFQKYKVTDPQSWSPWPRST